MIYFDSSAMIKLVLQEPESAAFREWVSEVRHETSISSSLIRVEVVRAASRYGADASARARSVLAGLETMPMTYALLDEAAALPLQVKSLDAIHLATAIRLRSELKAFVSYDKQLIAAASVVGLNVETPGAS
ncbi:type II toxin-antitoxin system VapC family toxin [Allokutzneria multivorans]|uniref:Ribonuclease VapC n=1 Tax=Allokutzneria multivorans TaxID=1142134 RepID=A0ABP7TJ65_9PSEU